MQQKTFREKCYKILKTIPKGKVTTYKAITEALGTYAYRAVGSAMNKNPYNREKYPCHRVVNASGKVGGYADNICDKIKRLDKEGVEVKNNKIMNLKEKLYIPKKL